MISRYIWLTHKVTQYLYVWHNNVFVIHLSVLNDSSNKLIGMKCVHYYCLKHYIGNKDKTMLQHKETPGWRMTDTMYASTSSASKALNTSIHRNLDIKPFVKQSDKNKTIAHWSKYKRDKQCRFLGISGPERKKGGLLTIFTCVKVDLLRPKNYSKKLLLTYIWVMRTVQNFHCN